MYAFLIMRNGVTVAGATASPSPRADIALRDWERSRPAAHDRGTYAAVPFPRAEALRKRTLTAGANFRPLPQVLPGDGPGARFKSQSPNTHAR